MSVFSHLLLPPAGCPLFLVQPETFRYRCSHLRCHLNGHSVLRVIFRLFNECLEYLVGIRAGVFCQQLGALCIVLFHVLVYGVFAYVECRCDTLPVAFTGKVSHDDLLLSSQCDHIPFRSFRARNKNRLRNTRGLDGYLAAPQNTWDKTAEVAAGADYPKMYFICGSADTVMYEHFKKFRDYAAQLGLEAVFTEVEGYGHEWRFWEKCVQEAINIFLPEDGTAGNAF